MVDATDQQEGVMIAFAPTSDDWCQIDPPHLTLVYAGKRSDLSATDYNNLAKDAASLAMLTRPFSLRVTGVETFGGDDDPLVRALRFRLTPELAAMRAFVDHWNKSQHRDFKPHCTIGPVGSGISNPEYDREIYPRSVHFNRIMVGWGSDYLLFNLNSSY